MNNVYDGNNTDDDENDNWVLILQEKTQNELENSVYMDEDETQAHEITRNYIYELKYLELIKRGTLFRW